MASDVSIKRAMSKTMFIEHGTAFCFGTWSRNQPTGVLTTTAFGASIHFLNKSTDPQGIRNNLTN